MAKPIAELAHRDKFIKVATCDIHLKCLLNPFKVKARGQVRTDTYAHLHVLHVRRFPFIARTDSRFGAGARRVQGECKESAGRVQGECEESAAGVRV